MRRILVKRFPLCFCDFGEPKLPLKIGIDIDAIGVILMVVGLIGGLLSLIFWSSWGGPAGVSRRRTTYVDEGPPL